MKEWVVSEDDLGCDGSYLSYNEVIRCKDCKYQNEIGTFDGKQVKYCEIAFTGCLGADDQFCSMGRRKDEAENI